VKIRYFKKLTSLTESSDITEVTFPNVFQNYIASKIHQRQGNDDKAKLFMDEFSKQVLSNVMMNDVPVADYQTYYKFVI
jgi:hypothetical protein